MSVIPMFDEPERNYNLPGFPPDFVKGTAHHNGLRYTYIGDDGEWLVILGHPERAQLRDLADFLDFGASDDPEATYGRILWECPDHKKAPSEHEEYCRMCNELEPGYWWLDWESKDGADANKNAPGYFPITVWEDLA